MNDSESARWEDTVKALHEDRGEKVRRFIVLRPIKKGEWVRPEDVVEITDVCD